LQIIQIFINTIFEPYKKVQMRLPPNDELAGADVGSPRGGGLGPGGGPGSTKTGNYQINKRIYVTKK
jgi:hypothetical protein